ncbi:MAG: hypothetical protein RBR68_11390 [Tenuifilaceae bacterium]|nr:hypothetical protein [Tenuifilaceae bacterium]
MIYNNWISVLEALKCESSTNAKIATLKENKDIKYLRRYLDYSTNKQITFGIKDIPFYKTTDNPISTFEEFEFLCDQLSTRKLTGNAAKQAIATFLSKCDSISSFWYIKAIQKDLSCIGLGLRLISKAFGEEKKFRCSGANPEDKLDKMRYTADAQQKINGFRVFWYTDLDGKVDSNYWDDRKLPIGRSGLAIDTFDFLIPFVEELNVKWKVIDCEVECDDNLSEIQSLFNFDRNKTIEDFTSKTGKVKKGWQDHLNRLEEIKDIMSRTKVRVFEILDRDEFESQNVKLTYIERRTLLEEFFKDKNYDRVKLVKAWPIKNKEEAIAKAEELIREGKEGVVVKWHFGKYGFTKDNSQIKIKRKAACDPDCQIVGWEPSKTVYDTKGNPYPLMLGNLILRYKNNQDKIVESGCGTGKLLTRQFKLDFAKNPELYIGRIVVATCMEFSEDGLMICPRVEYLRPPEDKNTID